MDDAKKFAIKKCPTLLENWSEYNWGYKNFEGSVLLGPVIAVEYKGKYRGIELKIEIWKLSNYFPEFSFDISLNKSQKIHDMMIEQLSINNYLREENILKTDLLYEEVLKEKM